MPRSLLVCTALALALSATAAWSASKAHEHGAQKLDIAVEGDRLTIDMEAPLGKLLGFERTPHNDAERKAAADVLSRLRAGDGLFTPDAAAACTLARPEVKAPVLEAASAGAAKGEHADLEARCYDPLRVQVREAG